MDTTLSSAATPAASLARTLPPLPEAAGGGCGSSALSSAGDPPLSSAGAPPLSCLSHSGHGFDGTASRLEAMLAHNARFVREGAYRGYAVAPDTPAARCVVLTCMDSRLTGLLPAALNIRPGEAKIIKTAGAILSHPFGGIMRSILVAIYELRASEVFIVGHEDCGMRNVNADATIAKMVEAGVPADRVGVLESAGVNVHAWLAGFDSVDDSVLAEVQTVRRHPLAPAGLRVTGLVINPVTGELRLAGAPHTHPECVGGTH